MQFWLTLTHQHFASPFPAEAFPPKYEKALFLLLVKKDMAIE